MSVSLGGLGILFIRNPFAELAAIVLGKGDIRSLFCLIVFLIVALVLAYLTNPSETSFRAYLTEQSFRHHLSRLDDNSDNHNGPYPRYPPKGSLITPFHFFIDSSPFSFANRASICLRTPKHVFHSFGIFTIAAMIPYSKPCDGENQDAWMVSDAWYIGAFGKWWRGGALEAWYQDVIARSKDEESWTSGILSMKRLDMLPDHTASFQAHFARGSSPELRNRERSMPRQITAQPRSLTPPPLPKSVSLPLHAIQRPLANAHYSCDRLSKMTSSPRPYTVNDSSRHGTCSQPRSPATLMEHSPLLDDVLRQITNNRESVLDIRTQLAECQSVSTRSHAVLQREVETYRERKQQEDTARLELKSRTKLLDDSKRGAEGAKKDAEKSLKSIQLVRDNAAHQLESLHQKILALQGHLLEDRDSIFSYKKQLVEHATNDTLEQKKADIQAAEYSVAILNQRSRELENRLSSERERLRILRQKSANQKPCYPFLEDMDLVSQHSDRRSHSLPSAITHGSGLNLSSFVTDSGADLFTTSDSQLLQYAQNGDICSTACVGNAEISRHLLSEVPQDATSGGNQEILSSVESKATFGPAGFVLSRDHTEDISGPCARTERNLNRNLESCNYPHHGVYQSSSCIPIFTPTSSDSDRSSEAHFQSYNGTKCTPPAKFNVEHTNRTQSLDIDSPAPFGIDYCHDTNGLDQSQLTRTLASTISLNLNEFNLFDNICFELSNNAGNASANPTFDALNPNGLGSTLVTPPSATSQSLLRAFAPSPAEREALQRALSGSTNASLERLPSLSAVGTLPSSPASSHVRNLPQHPHSLRDLRSFIPTWFKAFPRSRTIKFSPWDDDDSRNGDLQAQTMQRGEHG